MELDITMRVSVKLEGRIDSSTENHIYVEHLNRNFSVDVPNHITKEDRLRLKGLGKQSADGRRGDLYLEFYQINNSGVYRTKQLVCNKCGQELYENSKFCSNCGCIVGNNDDEKQNQRKIIYDGEIHKCPNCGEVMGAFMANCPSCGYELRGAKSLSSVSVLATKLENIESKRENVKQNTLKNLFYGSALTKTDEQKISLIRSFSIPNTKEDLYEFLIMSKSNIDIELYDDNGGRKNDARRAVSDAWKAKFEQAYQKAKIVFAGEQQLYEIQEMYDATQKAINKAKWKTWKLIGVLYAFIVIVFAVVGLIVWMSTNEIEKKEQIELARLNKAVEEIEVALENEEYKLALMYADNLMPNSDYLDDGTVRQWKIQREYWIEIVITAAADKGVELQYPENELEDVQVDDSVNLKQNNSQENLVEDEKGDEIVNSFNEESEETIVEPEVEETLILIEPGSEYSYMCDEYSLYTATALSDSLIKIECWTKNLSTSKTVSYEYDIGTFKINDKENEFSWLDKENTTFSIIIEDTEKSFFSKKQTAIFTVNNNTSDEYKGSNYNEQIVCYSYQNDDWHLYRMIPLTDDLMKIEVWYRSFAIGEFGYGYDLCVIDIESKTTDFEWVNDEYTEIAITLEDTKNLELKNPTLLTLSIENENFIYDNVKTFIDSKN